MSNDQLQNEIKYQLSKVMLLKMLSKNLITEEEYTQIDAWNRKSFQSESTQIYQKMIDV